jgi:hypothetical protein
MTCKTTGSFFPACSDCSRKNLGWKGSNLLFRYKPSRSYYTVLKKDGKTKWRNLPTTDKATARRMLADERNADAERF